MLASRRTLALEVVAVAALGAGGCLDRVVPEPSWAERAPDEAALSALLVERQYRGAGFVRLDRWAYRSTMNPDDIIHVYVGSAAAALYGQLTPDVAPSVDMRFPVGGVVVREVIDARGEVTQLTLAARLQAGFYPDGGDLFYATTDAGGTPLPAADGSHLQWGRLAECTACHALRAHQSFLFGVLAAQRAAP
jgi:hypothetical protein